MTKNNNIWIDGIMGVVTGDALGCPVQFRTREEVAKHPVTGMRGYGTFNLPEGSWTDDSSLTIALLESIRRLNCIELNDIMENFMKWLYDGEFTPYGESYDIGRTTMQAINRYKKYRKANKCGGDDEHSNGNGSLMRIIPACIYSSEMLRKGEYSEQDAIKTIHAVGGLTHNHIRANIACGLYFFMVDQILKEKDSRQCTQPQTEVTDQAAGEDALQDTQPSQTDITDQATSDGSQLDMQPSLTNMSGQIPGGAASLRSMLQAGLSRGFAFYETFLADKENLHYYDRLKDLDTFAFVSADQIRSSGYVADTLEAAVWSLITTDSFDQALLKAVNLGYDTDSVAAVAGGLAGLFYGYDRIPEDWLKAIKRREWIEEMCDVKL